ncbi:MAG: DUF1849 family protein [Alphaproteobacteria bacterium]|nr:DUF1849 family protein [Alphaproteobacteria bacterium]
MPPSVGLASFKAQYQLSLISARPDSGVLSSEGWMVSRFEEKCEGWKTNDAFYLSVGALDQPDHIIATKSTSYESKSGQNYRFQTEHWYEDGTTDILAGQAILDKNFEGSVRFTQPKSDQIKFTGALVFPTRFIKLLVQAARDKKNFFHAQMFDGSSHDVGAMATAAIGVGESANMTWSDEKSGNRAGSMATLRWPVSLALFAPNRPSNLPLYQVMIWLRENGISDEMRMDFGGFMVKASLVRLEKIAVKLPKKCPHG